VLSYAYYALLSHCSHQRHATLSDTPRRFPSSTRPDRRLLHRLTPSTTAHAVHLRQRHPSIPAADPSSTPWTDRHDAVRRHGPGLTGGRCRPLGGRTNLVPTYWPPCCLLNLHRPPTPRRRPRRTSSYYFFAWRLHRPTCRSRRHVRCSAFTADVFEAWVRLTHERQLRGSVGRPTARPTSPATPSGLASAQRRGRTRRVSNMPTTWPGAPRLGVTSWSGWSRQ